VPGFRVAAAALALLACGCGERETTTAATDPQAAAYAELVRRLGPALAHSARDKVTISGVVLDAAAAPVPGVDVVARGVLGELTVKSGADGTFRLVVAPGEYGVFVRDARVLTAARRQHPRIHGAPRAVTAGVPDDALLPRLVATADVDGLELRAVATALVRGQTVDPDGAPISGVVVRADCVERPVLGTDVAISDARGDYELRLPDGARCAVDATHAEFAGLRERRELELHARTPIAYPLVLRPGCIITGKVVDARGEPAGDGAIERLGVNGDPDFGPAGQLAPDGTFRYVTTDEDSITLRAWPWRSPPAPERELACDARTRIDDVVFRLPSMTPDLAGTLLDRAGTPVPFAFLDMAPRAPDGVGQQERTDANGRWRFYNVPPGPYAIRAHAPGHGVVSTSVVAPRTEDDELRLSGTARLGGTTTSLVDGSIELVELSCADFAGDRYYVEEPPRLVPVHAGTFALDGLPACKLAAHARWRTQSIPFEVDLTTGSGSVELALGTPRTKRVYGVVRDQEGDPVANALVTARTKTMADQVVVADGDGRYSLTVAPGVTLHASVPPRRSSTERAVGAANVDEERMDFVLPAR